jgi:hypothetical protein
MTILKQIIQMLSRQNQWLINDVEMNDVSTTIEQCLQVEAVCDSVEMDKADKTTDAYG